MIGGVKADVAHLQERRLGDGSATADGAETGQKHVDSKGFREIIVRAGVEPFDDVGGRVTGSKH